MLKNISKKCLQIFKIFFKYFKLIFKIFLKNVKKSGLKILHDKKSS